MYDKRLNRPRTTLRRAFSKQRQMLRAVYFSIAGLALAISVGTYETIDRFQTASDQSLRDVLAIEPAAGPASNDSKVNLACQETPPDPNAKPTQDRDCPAVAKP